MGSGPPPPAHTPGPWIVSADHSESGDESAICVQDEGEEWIVADVWLNIESEAAGRANANLIATAPELYEALKALVSAANEPSLGLALGPDYLDLRAAIRTADAAIAKAEGK